MIIPIESTLEVVLPSVPPAVGTAHAPKAKELEKVERAATILFVEDEPSIRQMAAAYLKAGGYRVIEANDGAEAVTLWAKYKGKIDLVLTDLMMPGGLNGRQLVERLQADRPDLKAIFVSGYYSDSSGQETVVGQTANFLQKPYRLKNLSDIVRDCLSRLKAA